MQLNDDVDLNLGIGSQEYSPSLFLESITLACYYESISKNLTLNIIVIIKHHLNF